MQALLAANALDPTVVAVRLPTASVHVSAERVFCSSVLGKRRASTRGSPGKPPRGRHCSATVAQVTCGSLEVIQHLKRTHPEVDEWFWVLGADTYNDLRAGKWNVRAHRLRVARVHCPVRKGRALKRAWIDASQEGGRFESEVNLLVVPRKGAGGVSLAGTAALLAMPHLREVSSTAVRASTDHLLLQAALHPAVRG